MTSAPDRSDLVVSHDEPAHRYLLHRGDTQVGVMSYRPLDGGTRVDVHSTRIDPSCRGQGLGEVLVADALEDLRSRDVEVQASCWFVADHLAAHPD